MKTNFKEQSNISPFYTGGNVCLDGKVLYSPIDAQVAVLDWATGQPLLCSPLQVDSDQITSLALSPNSTSLVVATRSLLLCVYEENVQIRSFKAHEAPVLAMQWDPSSTLLATGSADSSVKVWDMKGNYCTHYLKGHGGIITSIAFHPTSGNMMLYSAAEDGVIKVWDLVSKNCVATLSGHVSPVKGLDFSNDLKYLVSGGRDKIVNVWSLSDYSTVATIPVYEFIEACGVLGEDLIYTGGEKGIVKIWNWKTGALLHSFHADEMKKHAIVDIVHCQQDQTLVVITQDQNFLVYDVSNPVESIEKTRQLVGYNDQILDFAFVSGGEDADPQLATATNSEQIRVYDMQTRDCTVLAGHKEIVFCLDAFVAGSMLVSGSKDRSARVWKRVDGVYHNVGVCVGHTESVNAVAISPKTGRVLLSASQDRTIKSWDLSKCKFCVFNSVVAKESEGVENLKANYTFMAHEKDINALKIAPNEKVFASGSQDKTAKLWSMETGEQLGTFKGHKRGIWDVCFSPVDRVLATGSADKNVKIWSLADFSCLKTFEGHLNSVLRIRFISAGLQLVSSGADGLLKLWTVKTNECVNTFDGHEDKVWALEVDKSEMRIVSGGGDSKIVFWEDFTAVENEEARVEEELVIKEQQHLNTYIAKKDYKRAVKLALKMDRPVHLLRLLTSMRKNASIDLADIFATLIQDLDDDQKLLLFIRDWNTGAKHSEIAQMVLNAVLTQVAFDRILGLSKVKEIIESLAPYTDRHYARSKQLLVSSKVLYFE